VGPRAGLDGCGKSVPPQGIDPRTVQSVASRYTDRDSCFNGLSEIRAFLFKAINQEQTRDFFLFFFVLCSNNTEFLGLHVVR
jgi:hypothetical protein